MLLPSSVPRVAAAVGGGPLTRGLVGAATAGAEGGVYGGVDAATQGGDIPAGVLSGAVGGAAGQAVAQGVGQIANAGVKAIRGVNDAVPKNSMTVLPTGRTPTPMDYVNVAAAKAAAVGVRKGAEAGQEAAKTHFDKLLTGKDSKVIDPATGKASDRFTKTQQARMQDIVSGDPGSNSAEAVGDLLKNKLLAGAFGGGVGAASGGIIPGILTSGGTMGVGKMLTLDSAKGTQEAVDALRRLMYKKPAFKGPMSADRIRTLGQGLGYGAGAGLEDYLD
jgi:hypothetical protein